MSYSDTKTPREALAEFVRQETDGGREIMQFFLDVLRGRFEDAKMCHRVAAARELAKYGCEEAKEFLKAVASSRNGHTPALAPAEPRPVDELADFIKLETDDGKEVIRFYLAVLRNRDKDARMRHRISVGKELLKRAFDNAPVHADEDYQDESNEKCNNKSCYHWQYAVKRWHIDGHNREALEQIYGSEEAASVAIRAAILLRRNTVQLHSHVPDHDFTPIENPEDDPDGKGSYGYEILFASFGDNQAVRVANRAVEKYKKQLAKDLENEKASNQDPPAGHPQDSHAYADSEPGPVSGHTSPEHDSEQPQEPPAGVGLRPSRDPEKPPLPAGEGWGEGETPIGSRPSNPSSPAKSRVTQYPSVDEDSEPVRGYGHCRDCSETAEEGFQRSGDPDKPPAEHDSERLHDTPVGEGFEPSRDPEGPPTPKPPPKKIRRIIHLGPPSEDDPPDDDSRRYRDPDEIRVPLKDLLTISARPP